MDAGCKILAVKCEHLLIEEHLSRFWRLST